MATAQSDDRKRLLVVGSGWVGLYLAQYTDSARYDITVISPRRTSAYTPLLASAACGIFPFSLAEEPIRNTSSRRRCGFVKANALAVDFEKQVVHCEAAFDASEPIVGGRRFDMSYDMLVLCPGCEPNTFGTPGVHEHAIFVKHVSDAMALRKKLLDQLEKASLPCVSRDEAETLLHVAIVGGGPTGVEITAELYDLAQRELLALYPGVASLLRITIFDVAEHILASYDQKLYEYATERMVERGVRIETSSVIERVDDTSLHVKGKGAVPYGILLWVAGNKSVPLVEGLGAKKKQHGLVRILTDDRLRVLRKDSSEAAATASYYDNVFALGDAADVEGLPLPTTADVAVQKAKYLVAQLNRYRPDGDWAPFRLKQRGLVTYIGGHDGVAEGYAADEPWSGQRAWLSWRGGSFTWTGTWRNWIGLFVAMVMNALFGRDVMRL